MIIILDFGSQTSQLIARRLREAQVYCQLFPCDAPADEILALKPEGFVLSGGPASVYAEGAPQLPEYVIESGKPILGICYGMQAMTHALGGQVAASQHREYGSAQLRTLSSNALLGDGEQTVWMSHGDRIERTPSGFTPIAASNNAPIAAMADASRGYYGVQFHPEVLHTPGGAEILRRFAVEICSAPATWSPGAIVEQSIQAIRAQVGDANALSAISGGLDSSVASALVHAAIGDQLVSMFVDTGLLRQGEREEVIQALQSGLGIELVVVDAAAMFLADLKGVTDPEEKRRRIGERFIRVFEAQAQQLGLPPFLVQGTIYPDVIESRAPERQHAERIKTHHNVGGLPKKMNFKLVEPLRYLFKDEVRKVGESLGLPPHLLWRQPFPGPGLAVRCLGEVTGPRLAALRAADAIFTSALKEAGLVNRPHAALAQAFAVLLPVRSVGVMGDQRTYQETIALRAVSSQDFMTADWAALPDELLRKISSRIVNEVAGVNRVVYDISSKPPATIEWE
ncbi:MAG: glutamine-hydrolyzing GMP synthase [Anaerolineales bacterium]|nr:MAG: glutamine-hydrolyzing GMP synthase [Anaerolineales bacterium]